MSDVAAPPRSRDELITRLAAMLAVWPTFEEDTVVEFGPEDLDVTPEEMPAFESITIEEVYAAAADLVEDSLDVDQDESRKEILAGAQTDEERDTLAALFRDMDDRADPEVDQQLDLRTRRRVANWRAWSRPSVPPSVEVVAHAILQASTSTSRSRERRPSRRRRSAGRAGPDSDDPEPPGGRHPGDVGGGR